jgi:hypothetical protein
MEGQILIPSFRRDQPVAGIRRGKVIAILAGVVCVYLQFPAIADPLSPPSQGIASCDESVPNCDAHNNGFDYTRPQTNLGMRLLYQDSSSASARTERETLFLRWSQKIDLASGWKLGLLGQLPFSNQEVLPYGPPGAVQSAGVGDTTAQVALTHALSQRWAFGFGARFVAPTAEDNLGSGKWQIMPGAGVRISLPELGPDSYFSPVARYAISVAGNSTRRDINELQIAPTLNIGLPDRWFVSLFPSNDVRLNYGRPSSGQTGHLFLPFDAAVGRELKSGLVVTLEMSVPLIKDYPVYNFKSQLTVSQKF